MSKQLEPITLVYAGMHMRKGHRFNTERPCPNKSHLGQPDVFHYSCFDCGADCTAGAKAGPATSDIARVRRCRECNLQHQQAKQVYTSEAIGLFEAVTRYFTRAAAAALLIGVSLAGHGQTFTRSSSVEMGLAAASITADALTTRGMLSRGWEEKNPLAHPFTTSPGGTAAYFGGSFALLVLANNRLRNHPRWRHALNWSVIGTETFWAAHNSQLGRCKRGVSCR